MSVVGQSRRSDPTPMTSGLPLKADILRVCQHVSKVPLTDIGCPSFNDFEGLRASVSLGVADWMKLTNDSR